MILIRNNKRNFKSSLRHCIPFTTVTQNFSFAPLKAPLCRKKNENCKQTKMWPEILSAKQENKRELSLTGDKFKDQLGKNDGKLDPALFELKQLNFLQLSHCAEFCELPDDIQKLETLQNLLLFGNRLSSLPGEFRNNFLVN